MYRQKRGARPFWSLFLLGALLMLSLAACGTSGSGSASNTSGNISTPTPAASASPSPTAVPLTVKSVDMAVSPSSLKGYACGKTLTVTYTATFHFPSGNAGGQVAFQYTINNGRGSTQAELTVQPGQTTVPYRFTWSGALPADHTMPEPGGVMVTSPNALTSSLLGPSGACSTGSQSAFKVTSIELSASPSLNGHVCGTLFTEKYTAVFHIASHGPGGTIVFTYTTNNGQSNSPEVSLSVAPDQTTKTYTFTWTGLLSSDHTTPGVGIILMTAPNQGESPAVSPKGQCS